MVDLSNRLVQLKTERNLLQKDIAKGSGIPLRTYSYYEKGKIYPPSNTLVKLADYFNVSTDYLLGRSDNPVRR